MGVGGVSAPSTVGRPELHACITRTAEYCMLVVGRGHVWGRQTSSVNSRPRDVPLIGFVSVVVAGRQRTARTHRSQAIHARIRGRAFWRTVASAEASAKACTLATKIATIACSGHEARGASFTAKAVTGSGEQGRVGSCIRAARRTRGGASRTTTAWQRWKGRQRRRKGRSRKGWSRRSRWPRLLASQR